MSNSVEDDFELSIVLTFKFIQTAREFSIGYEHLPQLYKGAHDFDIDYYCALTP